MTTEHVVIDGLGVGAFIQLLALLMVAKYILGSVLKECRKPDNDEMRNDKIPR